ncbi:MAG: DUF1849 family protein [Pseudomonadota bacterium]
MADLSARGVWRVGAAWGLACWAGLSAGAAMAAEPLAPHRAIYDLGLSDVAPSTSLVAASGRLVFELTGSVCEGFTVDFRNVTRVTDREGTRRVTDLRSTTLETIAPPTLSFQHQTYVDDELASEIDGMASARAGGTSVEITVPKGTQVGLGRAIFPTAHTRLIIEAALAGETILEAPVYDGGDEADVVYETATVIGPGGTDLPRASDAEREVLMAIPGVAEMTAWRLVVSYFQGGAAEGERVPEYELTFMLLENGVSYDVTFNYGAFSLAGQLTALEVSPAPPCDG